MILPLLSTGSHHFTVLCRGLVFAGYEDEPPLLMYTRTNLAKLMLPDCIFSGMVWFFPKTSHKGVGPPLKNICGLRMLYSQSQPWTTSLVTGPHTSTIQWVVPPNQITSRVGVSFLTTQIVTMSICKCNSPGWNHQDGLKMLGASEYSSHGRQLQPATMAAELNLPRVLCVLSSTLEKLVARNEKLVDDLNQQLDGLSCGSVRLGKSLNAFHGVRAPGISIPKYLERIYKYTDCSPSCFVVGYVYIDRLTHRHPDSLVLSLNVHRLLVTSVMVASKMLDDEWVTPTPSPSSSCWMMVFYSKMIIGHLICYATP